jgi:nucleoprotein TPR
VQFLKSQSDERQWELEKRDREVSSTRRHFELAQAELERMRNVMHEKECQFIEQREMMERDLNKERELVLLKEQVMVLAKDQRDTALEELKSIKVMAAEAAEREGRLESEMESRLKVEVENAVRLIKQEEEGKRVVIADRLRAAEEEKMRLEEDVLNTSTPLKGRRLIAGATVPLAITEGSEDGPLSLTDLYTRLAETEDDLRAEQHENKKLKIIIDRIHRDVASKTPIFQQKQLELENALEELDENRERLDHARREVVDLRADNHDFELKNQEMENECRELKRENHDLALQVQRLLQRGMGQGTGDDSVTFDSIQTLQEQNQKLLRDHRSMSDKIQTLESHINNNHEKLELDQMKEEIVNLRDEREKQLKLVAGIVHQRDLYRALVAKNDAALVQSEGGNQLALVDARAEQLPLLEVKNRELVEEAAKLRADVSTFKYEKEALESRLARIDAHAEELTSSNERMRGEITAANTTMARMEADLNQSRGRCERMQISLDAMKDEKESETSKRNRMEELNSKLQMHLDGARSTLAKQQQQFESVRYMMC